MFRKVVLVVVMLLLAACDSAPKEEVLIVAHDATWPPMEYVDANKQIVGYSVDYIDAIAKEVGIKVQHENAAWEGIFAQLAAGKYHVISSSVTITEERAKAMDFSIPYYTVQQAVIAPFGSGYVNTDSLNGKRLGAQLGTTGYFAAHKIIGDKAKSYNDIALAMEDLKNGNLDAVICDDPVAADYALQSAGNKDALEIAFVIDSAEEENYGFAIRKGDTKTLELINKGVKAVKEKGIEAELIKKWIGK